MTIDRLTTVLIVSVSCVAIVAIVMVAWPK